MRFAFLLTGLPVTLLMLLCSGCGSGAHDPNRPPVVKVSGTVTHNGQAVESATVLFAPVGDGPGATGLTDADGTFQLRTFDPGDGAVPGQYKVAIFKYDMSTSDPDLEDDLANELRADTDQLVGPTPLLPVQYAEVETTPLTQEVSASGENQFAFEL